MQDLSSKLEHNQYRLNQKIDFLNQTIRNGNNKNLDNLIIGIKIDNKSIKEIILKYLKNKYCKDFEILDCNIDKLSNLNCIEFENNLYIYQYGSTDYLSYVLDSGNPEEYCNGILKAKNDDNEFGYLVIATTNKNLIDN